MIVYVPIVAMIILFMFDRDLLKFIIKCLPFIIFHALMGFVFGIIVSAFLSKVKRL